MVDLERLRARGLQAYEVSRVRMALRVSAFLAPMFALCWLVGERELCGCLMPVLAVLAVWLRWRDRRGLEAVTVGLVAGSLPLAAGLLLTSIATRCGGPWCLTLSAAVGVAAGVWVAVQQSRRSPTLSMWLAATSITALAAVMGCSALGAFGIAAVVAGVAFGSGLGAAATVR